MPGTPLDPRSIRRCPRTPIRQPGNPTHWRAMLRDERTLQRRRLLTVQVRPLREALLCSPPHACEKWDANPVDRRVRECACSSSWFCVWRTCQVTDYCTTYSRTDVLNTNRHPAGRRPECEVRATLQHVLRGHGRDSAQEISDALVLESAMWEAALAAI